LTVKSLVALGKTHEEIRTTIDSKYKDAGLTCSTSDAVKSTIQPASSCNG
jgi:hypothetical protein